MAGGGGTIIANWEGSPGGQIEGWRVLETATTFSGSQGLPKGRTLHSAAFYPTFWERFESHLPLFYLIQHNFNLLNTFHQGLF